MNISVTLPDSTLEAWGFALENYNAASPIPLDLPAYVNDIIVGAQTNTNVDTFNAYQLTKLKPLGEKYNAAPAEAKAEVDALLEPYN